MGGNQFVRKGYGRIFIQKAEDRDIVKKTIEEVDSFEYEYFSDDIISVLDPNKRNDLIYTHKFEICMDKLTLACARKGIWIWCVSQDKENWDPLPIASTI